MGQALPEFVRLAGDGDWRIQVWVQPGAKRNEVASALKDLEIVKAIQMELLYG